MRFREDVAAFAERVTALGFVVYVSERGPYGFITDATASRVLSFSFNDGGSLGGNYGPPSTSSGTGWRMEESPYALVTPDDVKVALYAYPPHWVGGGWRYLTTVAQYLQTYGVSSRFARYTGEAR